MKANSNAAPLSEGSGASAGMHAIEAARSVPASTDQAIKETKGIEGNPQLERVAAMAQQAFASMAAKGKITESAPRRAGYALASAWKSIIGEEPSRRDARAIAEHCNALHGWQFSPPEVEEAAGAMRQAYPKTTGTVDLLHFARLAIEAFKRHAMEADDEGLHTLVTGDAVVLLEWWGLAMAALIQHAMEKAIIPIPQRKWAEALIQAQGLEAEPCKLQPRISAALRELTNAGLLIDPGTGYTPPQGGKPGRAKEYRITQRGLEAMAPVLAEHQPGTLKADVDRVQVLELHEMPPSKNVLWKGSASQRGALQTRWNKLVASEAERQGIRPMRGRAEVRIHVRESTRNRDESNVRYGAEMVIHDALVNAGLIEDDGPDFIDAPPATVERPPKGISKAEREANWQALVRIELRAARQDRGENPPDPPSGTGEGE